MEKIRIHHLLCLPLFAGEGYSDNFCVNMGKVKRSLEANPGRRLETVCGPDLVCAHCPNLRKISDGHSEEEDRFEKTVLQNCDSEAKKPEQKEELKQKKSPEQNKKSEWICREENNHVVEKDRELADWLGIREGAVYTWQELLQLAAERLTEEQFMASCSRCQWFQQGLCSYQAWREAI